MHTRDVLLVVSAVLIGEVVVLVKKRNAVQRQLPPVVVAAGVNACEIGADRWRLVGRSEGAGDAEVVLGDGSPGTECERQRQGASPSQEIQRTHGIAPVLRSAIE